VFIAPISRAGSYSLVAAMHACWITVHISIMGTKVPKKFKKRSTKKYPQNDEENRRNNIMNKEERNSSIQNILAK